MSNEAAIKALCAEAVRLRPHDYPPTLTKWRNGLDVEQRFTLSITRVVRRPDGPMDPEVEGATAGIRPALHVAEIPQNVPIEIVIAPGEEVMLPSMFDGAIQQIECNDRDCRSRAGYCQKGHPGRIVAGLAPQLTKIGGAAKLHPVFAEDAPSNVVELPRAKRRRVEG